MEICRLELKMTAVDKIELPEFAGSTLRGAFGNILKEACCIHPGGKCSECMIRQRCAYTYLFESGWFFSNGDKIRSGVPQPFVIEPPIDYEQGNVHDELKLGIILFGEGIAYLQYFITCFEEIGHRGLGKSKSGYILESVTDKFGDRKIWERDKREILKKPQTRQWADYEKFAIEKGAVKRCQINFVTPLRIKKDGHLQDQINFEMLIRALVRRWSLLHKYYDFEEADVDMGKLLPGAKEIATGTLNLHWQELERYSRRQDQRMMLGGILGMMECEGELEQFIPWLLLGQDMHIGKNTSFGLGQYELICK